MDQIGELTQWNDQRGFGFITVPGRTGRFFVHISAFKRSARPELGDRIEFVSGTGRDGKPAAIQALVLSGQAQVDAPPASLEHFDRHNLRVWGACALIVLIFATLILDRAPFALGAYYLVTGALSFMLYWWDKHLALAGAWRIAELRLHGIDLLGGIVGGLLAQHNFRHKTSKPGFARTSTFIALAHGLGLAGIGLGLIDTAGFLSWLEINQ